MSGDELLVVYRTGEYLFNEISCTDDYFCYYVGDYVFRFYSGSISLDGTEFYIETGTCAEITVDYSGDNGLSIVYSDVVDSSVAVGDSLVISNLGSYPRFDSSTSVAVYYIAILITVISLCMFVRSWFSHTYNHLSRGG